MSYNSRKSYFYVRDAGTVQEGDYANFTIERTGDLSRYEKITYYTYNGSAQSNSDYRYKSGTAYFSPGQSESNVSVQTYSDNYSESTESFRLYAYSPKYRSSNGRYYSSSYYNSIGDSTGTAYISDTPNNASISVSDATALEGENLTFKIIRSGNTSRSGYVYYRVSNGTAVNGHDYEKGSGYYVRFSAGETEKTVSVKTNKDLLVEGNETVKLNLYSSSYGFDRVDSEATGTILDGTVHSNPVPGLPITSTGGASVGGNGGNSVGPVVGNGNGNSGNNNGNQTNTINNITNISDSFNFTYTSNVSAVNLSGTAGNDLLFGSQPGEVKNEKLNGGKGNDKIFGRGGADELIGGSGNDSLAGGAGGDILQGDAGNDDLNGGKGSDGINGGTGNDLIKAGAGGDVINGGAGADIIIGGGGKNIINAGGDSIKDIVKVLTDGNALGRSSHNKADYLMGLGANDQIMMDVNGSAKLSFGSANVDGLKDSSGIGIFVDNQLEAVVAGLSQSQVQAITTLV